jgi:putative hydrolase of the HAD superfamily
LLIKMRIELTWLAERSAVPADQVEQLAAKIADYCYNYARTCVEQARPILAALAEKYPMVLVSNFYGNVDSVLRDFDLRRYFQGVIESAVVGVRKPDPRIFMLGVVALGLKPEEVMVVGDSLRKDILPAESIGCKTAWIKGRGWTPDEDAATHPSQIPSLSALLQLL